MKTDSLGQAGVEIALKGAVAYLQCHNLKADDQTLFACIRSHCKAAAPAALADAKEAFACGMTEVGIQTFAASMTLAGVEAAKEASKPAEHFHCNQCEALTIQGVFFHETGCPNSYKRYIDGEWVKVCECRECGNEVMEGERCCNE